MERRILITELIALVASAIFTLASGEGDCLENWYGYKPSQEDTAGTTFYANLLCKVKKDRADFLEWRKSSNDLVSGFINVYQNRHENDFDFSLIAVLLQELEKTKLPENSESEEIKNEKWKIVRGEIIQGVEEGGVGSSERKLYFEGELESELIAKFSCNCFTDLDKYSGEEKMERWKQIVAELEALMNVALLADRIRLFNNAVRTFTTEVKIFSEGLVKKSIEQQTASSQSQEDDFEDSQGEEMDSVADREFQRIGEDSQALLPSGTEHQRAQSEPEDEDVNWQRLLEGNLENIELELGQLLRRKPKQKERKGLKKVSKLIVSFKEFWRSSRFDRHLVTAASTEADNLEGIFNHLRENKRKEMKLFFFCTLIHIDYPEETLNFDYMPDPCGKILQYSFVHLRNRNKPQSEELKSCIDEYSKLKQKPENKKFPLKNTETLYKQFTRGLCDFKLKPNRELIIEMKKFAMNQLPKRVKGAVKIPALRHFVLLRFFAVAQSYGDFEMHIMDTIMSNLLQGRS